MNLFLFLFQAYTSYRVISFKLLPPPVQYHNEKRPASQPEPLLDEGIHGRAALVGSLAFFNFGTERGGRGTKTPFPDAKSPHAKTSLTKGAKGLLVKFRKKS